MKNKKRVAVAGGQQCPKCGKQMQRYEHASNWKPKRGQPYYFSYWDNCNHCHRHVQMYESAKVLVGQEEVNALDRELFEISAPQVTLEWKADGPPLVESPVEYNAEYPPWDERCFHGPVPI